MEMIDTRRGAEKLSAPGNIYITQTKHYPDMIIASQLRKENIAQYLLYMWQIEDLIRANGLDIDKITETVVNLYTHPRTTQADDRNGTNRLSI